MQYIKEVKLREKKTKKRDKNKDEERGWTTITRNIG